MFVVDGCCESMPRDRRDIQGIDYSGGRETFQGIQYIDNAVHICTVYINA